MQSQVRRVASSSKCISEGAAMPEVVLEEILISDVSSPCIIQVEEENKSNLRLSNNIRFQDQIQKKDSYNLLV